jgi:CheY-like chemotaxis protein
VLLEQRAGCVTIGAEDGEIALSLARLHHPDLIQSCINNPTLSGFEFARLLKGDDRTKQIPLICVSATVMRGGERKVFDAGFNAYLPKPITQVEYLGLIDSFLREG